MKQFLMTVLTLASVSAYAGGGHSDDHKEGDEAEAETEAGKVGADKGITEAHENEGFKLSPEALKNFDLKYASVTGAVVQIPSSARVTTGEEVNLYRARDGFFKRIDFQVVKAGSQTISVKSEDLRQGDQVVIQGHGFLRIAELAAFGGVADSHGH